MELLTEIINKYAPSLSEKEAGELEAAMKGLLEATYRSGIEEGYARSA
jgi:hypothetical protein